MSASAVSSPTLRRTAAASHQVWELHGAVPAAAPPAAPPPAGGPPRPSALKRLGSALEAWSSTSSLLRHSSIGAGHAPTGGVFQGCYYIVSTVGAPFLLGLPAAVSHLTWAPGLIVLVLAYLAVLYTACLTARLHEYKGTRHTRYRDLGQAVLGKRRGTLAILPFQMAVNVGMCVSYPVIAGQALRGICVSLAPGGTCGVSLSLWIAIFCSAHLVLALGPDISSINWVTALGAATTLGYSILATVGAAMAGREPGVTYALQGSTADKAFNACSSLGAIVFLYGNTVLVETQATLRGEPSAVQPMVRAVLLGYSCVAALLLAVVITGYWAFGAAVQPLVLDSIAKPTWLVVAANFMVVANSLAGYLIFAHSLFDWVDLKLMMSHWTGLEFQGGLLLILKRFSFRWGFVVITAAMAVCLPFFQDLMGLLGGICYSPLCFIIPCVLWLKAQRGALPWWEVALCWTIIIVFVGIGGAAAVGSVRSLIVRSDEYEFFSR